MKNLLAVIALVAMTGCATKAPSMLNVQGGEQSEKLVVPDLRPAVEKQGEMFSLLITSDAYGIRRLDEAATTPSAVRLLQHRTFEVLGSQAGMSSLKVRHLVVYQNAQSTLRRGALGAGLGGVIGAVAAGATAGEYSGVKNSLADEKSFEAQASSEFKRALYTEAENPSRGSVYVVFIETELNGKHVFTRTLAPVKQDKGQDALAMALESSVKYHLAQY